MYKQMKNPFNNQIDDGHILRIADNACIPFDPMNVDYQAYLKFLADGGTPLPAEENK